MNEFMVNVKGHTVSCQVERRSVSRMTLKITPSKGLQCLSPHGVSDTQIASFIHANQDWLKKQVRLLGLSEQFCREHNSLPEQLQLGFDNSIFIVVHERAHRSPRVQRTSKQLQVYSNGSAVQVRQLLKSWIIVYAGEHLGARINALSTQHQLPFAGLSMGFAKMRWGSCRHDKAIRLNPLLLFLPRPIVEHVMLHELCHTVHHNHSKAFWALLEELDPNINAHKSFLRDTSKLYSHIPPFFWP